MKSEKLIGDVKVLQYLRGEVTLVTGRHNTLDVDFGSEIGEIVDIPIAYLCQDALLEPFSYKAFAINNTVIAEWDAKNGVPSANSLRIIGFSDGFPRHCKQGIIAITSELHDYVAFFNYELNCCYVPPTWDAGKVIQSWSGTEPDWIYFQIQSGETFTFIQDILQDSPNKFIKPGLDIIYPDHPDGEPYSSTHDTALYDPRYSSAFGYTDITACSGGPYTVTYSGLTSASCGPEVGDTGLSIFMRIITYFNNTLEYPEENGVEYMPVGWTCQPRSIKTLHKETYPTWPAQYEWNTTEAGPDYSMKGSGGTWPAQHWEGNITPWPYSPYCAAYECAQPIACNSQAVYHGLSRRWFLHEHLDASWQIPQLSNAGSGNNQIAMPIWPWLPPVSSNQVFARPHITRATRTLIFMHSRGTVGYTFGEYKNVDWNWGSESGFYYDAVYNTWGYDFHFLKEDTVSPAVPISYDGEKYTWENPQKRSTRIYMNGKGFQINREQYYNIVTEEIKEHIKDRVDREVHAYWHKNKQQECSVEPGFCAICEPPMPELEDNGTFIRLLHEDLSGGIEFKFGGKASNDIVVAFELWCEHHDSSSTNFTPTISLLSSYKYPEEDETDEWAENKVLSYTADWLMSFFLKMSAATTQDDIRYFVEHQVFNIYEPST